MKVVYLNPVGALGGAERSLLDILVSVRQTMPAAQLSLVVATPGPLIQEAEKIGVRVLLLPMPPEMAEFGDSGWIVRNSPRAKMELVCRTPRAGLAASAYVRKLRATLAALQPDLVHTNGIKSHLLAGLASGSTWPVIWHIRDFLSLRPVVGRLLRWAKRRARGGIVISRAVEGDVRKTLGALPIEMIHNAVDTHCFSPGPGAGSNLDALAGFPPAPRGTLRVGLVATFARWKGQEVFLEAAAQFVHASPASDVRFYIIGGPIYSTQGSQHSEFELRTKAATLGLSSRLGLIGFHQYPAEIYRALDVVVHASTQPEPFGRTIVEAMACARPVIVSEGGGATELFTHEHDAVGFPIGNSAALARRIQELAGSPTLRARLALNARRTAEARFDRVRLGPQILAAYRRFLHISDAA